MRPIRWMSSGRLMDLLIERLPKTRSGRVDAIEYLNEVAQGKNGETLKKGIFDLSEDFGVFVSNPTFLKESPVFGSVPIRVEFEKNTLIVESAIDAILFPTLLCAKADIHAFCSCSTEKIWLKFGTEQALRSIPSDSFIILSSHRDVGTSTEASKCAGIQMINIQCLFLAAAGLRRTLFSELGFKKAKFVADTG